MPVSGLGAMLDNIIVLRHVELRARLHRIVSVLKTRSGPSDPTLREFTIGKGTKGIDVSSTFESAEAILSGLARVVPAPPTSRSPKRARGASRRRRK